MLSDKKIFSCFPYMSMQNGTPGSAHFWPLMYNLNKLGRGPLGDATYQTSRLYALWFQTRRFHCVFPICLCKTCDLRGSPIFGLRGIVWTNLVESTRWYYIPNIKALGLVVSDKIIFMFSLFKSMQNMWPPGRAHFGPRGIIWMNFV